MSDRKHFISGLAGVLVGALLVGGPAAVAAIGDAIRIGQTNTGNARTTITGDVNGALVKITNAGAGDIALQLESDGPNLKVSNGKKIKKLNADKVDSFSANELIRAEWASTLDAADANGAVLTLSITAPVDGMLIVSGNLSGEFVSAYDRYVCDIEVDLAVVQGTTTSAVVDDAGASHTKNTDEDCTTTGGIEVDAGPHTVTLNASGRDTATFYGATLWAIFVPFDGTGAQVVVP